MEGEGEKVRDHSGQEPDCSACCYQQRDLHLNANQRKTQVLYSKGESSFLNAKVLFKWLFYSRDGE